MAFLAAVAAVVSAERFDAQPSLPPRQRLPLGSVMVRGAAPQATTASGSRALTPTWSGGARAEARSRPFTTRIVAGAMTTVRTRMGLPRRGQEILLFVENTPEECRPGQPGWRWTDGWLLGEPDAEVGRRGVRWRLGYDLAAPGVA